MKFLFNKITNLKDKILKQRVKNLYKGNLPFGIINSKTAICFQDNFFYTRIPKAANSTVIASLYGNKTGIELSSTDEVLVIKDSYYTKLDQLSASQFKALESLFKFSLVRHPVTRVTSAYLDKIKNMNAPQRRLVAHALNKKETASISFDEFLDYLEHGGIHQNGHWSLQHDLLYFPKKEYDFIGKIENLKEDLAFITEKVYKKKCGLISVRPHARDEHSLDTISASQLAKIKQIYHSDFELFEYST